MLSSISVRFRGQEPLLCAGERPKTSHLEALLPAKPVRAPEMKAEVEEKSVRQQFERLMEQEKVSLEPLGRFFLTNPNRF